jgi:hypothetical protein
MMFSVKKDIKQLTLNLLLPDYDDFLLTFGCGVEKSKSSFSIVQSIHAWRSAKSEFFRSGLI